MVGSGAPRRPASRRAGWCRWSGRTHLRRPRRAPSRCRRSSRALSQAQAEAPAAEPHAMRRSARRRRRRPATLSSPWASASGASPVDPPTDALVEGSVVVPLFWPVGRPQHGTAKPAPRSGQRRIRSFVNGNRRRSPSVIRTKKWPENQSKPKRFSPQTACFPRKLPAALWGRLRR